LPIHTPRRLLGRKQVAWFGSVPPDDAKSAFVDRGFLVASCTDADLRDPAYLAGLSAVIFSQSIDKPLQVAQGLENHAQRLLNYDCLVVIRPGSAALSEDPSIFTNVLVRLHLWTAGLPSKEAAKLKWQESSDAVPPLPHVAYFGYAVSWPFIANAVADNPSGTAPNLDLKITVDDVVKKLDPDSELLVRRAFWDCADIHLVAMDEGNSGVRVYRAYAELACGLYGQWPQAFFVKIGDRSKIFAEYTMYEENVDPYIPFHLGPHLARERCCLGASLGLIVGDFVEESESLGDCAYQGRAATAIACLFDRTLLGWHRSPRKVSTSLSESLLHCFPRKISTSRFTRALALGATQNLNQLRLLFERCKSEPVLVGPIHGDLHAANVRVRATDAIVIDFYAHRKFPLLYDAACLEASLLVEGFADDKRDIQEWLLSLTPLYEQPLLDGTLPHPNPKDRSCWFHTCVRQIRRYARQWECGKDEDQYAAALAVALLTKAVKDKDAPEPEASRRAAAYVLAEVVLRKTFDEQSPAVSGAVKAS
jgi:hypothetical protein